VHVRLGIFTVQGFSMSKTRELGLIVEVGAVSRIINLLCPSYLASELKVSAGIEIVKIDLCLAVVPDELGL